MESYCFATPMTYMNLSGKSVQQITRFYQIASEDVVVVCDDMNLPLGTLRWRASGSSGGRKRPCRYSAAAGDRSGSSTPLRSWSTARTDGGFKLGSRPISIGRTQRGGNHDQSCCGFGGMLGCGRVGHGNEQV